MKYILLLAISALLALGAYAFWAGQVTAPQDQTDEITPPADDIEREPVTDSDGFGVPNDVRTAIKAKADLIRVNEPEPLDGITSPLTITGEARGTWFFEATFPIVLVDWDGRIIAEGYAQAQGEWMTEAFVPFSATLSFESPVSPADPDFIYRGSLILQKANASGLPENDDALEIPIRF